MNDLHLPWLELSILIPLIGAIVVFRTPDPILARKWCVGFTGATLVSTVGAWLDFAIVHSLKADDPTHILRWIFGPDAAEIITIDHLSAPLLPLVALIFFLTTLTTMRTKIRRISFASTLVSETITLATFCCDSDQPWLIIGLLAAGTIPPFFELLDRRKPTMVYVLHMSLFIVLMVVGQFFIDSDGRKDAHTLWGIVPLLFAVFVRSGVAPFHCWMTDLYERATFATALLFTIPLAGAFAALRLVLPIAPDWVLHSLGGMALLTAVYAAGMSLVQKEGRRFFCYILLSHSALVLVGLEMGTAISLTGGLCVWLSVGMGLGGFGLTLRSLESRRGRLSLADYQGLYEHTPNLAMLFMLTGLASVGFPGTVGFIGTELLVDGAVEESPYIGIAVVLASALNGIAMVHAYFLLFTGKRYASTISLMIGARERFAVLALALLILVGGLVPHPGVASRYEAAEEVLELRKKNGLYDETIHHMVHPPHGMDANHDDASHTEKKSEKATSDKP